MKTKVMRGLLHHFAKMQEEAGDEGTAKGLRTLANLLPANGQTEVRNFLSEVKRARPR